jgi:hypothetical protein
MLWCKLMVTATLDRGYVVVRSEARTISESKDTESSRCVLRSKGSHAKAGRNPDPLTYEIPPSVERRVAICANDYLIFLQNLLKTRRKFVKKFRQELIIEAQLNHWFICQGWSSELSAVFGHFINHCIFLAYIICKSTLTSYGLPA